MTAATDGGSTVTITSSDAESSSCAGAKTILRTWTAHDQCGNSASAVQTITVVDTQKPTLVCPADKTLECPADVSAEKTGIATATDVCSTVTITFNDAESSSCV